MERDRPARWTTGLLIAVALVAALWFDFWGASRTEPDTATTTDAGSDATKSNVQRETADVASVPRIASAVPTAPQEPGRDRSQRFTLLPHEGFHFASATVVSDAREPADLRAIDYPTSDPGLIGLLGAGGMATALQELQLADPSLDPGVLFERIARVDADAVTWRTSFVAAVASVADDVLLVRVKAGGIAKVRILHHGDGTDSAAAFPVTFHYEYAPDGSQFGSPSHDLRPEGALVFDGPTASTLAAFSGDGTWTSLPTLRGEGDVPDPYVTEEILLADGSGSGAYSFEHARRRARGAPRLAPQLDFGRSGLSVNPRGGGGDSTITWSGNHATWGDVASTQVLPQAPDVRAAARRGALYYVRTRGRGPPRDTLVLGTAYVFKEQFAFEWISLANGRFTQSPTLTASPAEITKLRAHLQRLANGGRQFRATALTTEAARKTLRVLTTSPPPFDLAYGARIAEMLDLFTRSGTPAVLETPRSAGARDLRTEVDPQVRRAADLLDAATRQHGLGWTIDREGRIVILESSSRR